MNGNGLYHHGVKGQKWIHVMDQFTDYKKEHPNSDMQFNGYVAMIQKDKESKK